MSTIIPVGNFKKMVELKNKMIESPSKKGNVEGVKTKVSSLAVESASPVKNLVLQKLLRAPRYFDWPKRSSSCSSSDEEHPIFTKRVKKQKVCHYCGDNNHVTTKCEQIKRMFDILDNDSDVDGTSSVLCLKCGDTGHQMFSCNDRYDSSDIQECPKSKEAALCSNSEVGDQSLQESSKNPEGGLKRVCETELGIVSQCCQPKQAVKCNKQYMENVALKINVKVGGQNTVLEGADVTHPSPGEDLIEPLHCCGCGFVGLAIVSAQSHREEIIHDLYRTHQDTKRGTVHAGTIREHLMAFYRRTRNKPSRMIFYRDGSAVRNGCYKEGLHVN